MIRSAFPSFPRIAPRAAGICLFSLAGFFLSGLVSAADPFAEGVRSTPWLKPEEERQKFKLPPGFEIQLVAAEPEIQKPLNMAFDERGRIWLTCSVEYPYAAPLDKQGQSNGRDSIRILEDTDGDGRYEKVTIFAAGLNIPMGIYPWRGGCIAYSIPYLWLFKDLDGDGKCDERVPLYGPFDHTRDTHGMVNGLRRGFDGWLYACHGFNNDSRIPAGGGRELRMQSGNTFRVRLDGSWAEHHTHGQVNPFGMCQDELGRFFSADCHTKPIYQLVPGGSYPSFGKPHDGLGFIPPMMDHLHGSTAIAGVTSYTGDHFPPAYRGLFFSGNVMTSRINCNRIEARGATLKAVEQPDLISCDDPWFRPVDVQIGPDGALYLLDFYNRIIGHYEVPLTHPGRDRTSGRIWRIVYRGDHPEAKPLRKPVQLSQLSPADLVRELDHPNLEYRLRVQHFVADERAEACQEAVAAAWKTHLSERQAVSLLWLLHSLPVPGAVDESRRIAADPAQSVTLRNHALLSLANSVPPPGERDLPVEQTAAQVLADPNPILRSSAALVLSRLAPRGLSPATMQALLTALGEAPASDPILRQSLRIALRDALAQWPKDSGRGWRNDLKFTKPDSERELGEIAIVAASPGATEFVLALLAEGRIDLSHPSLDISRLAAAASNRESAAQLVLAFKPAAGAELDRQAEAVKALQSGFARAGISSPELIAWGEEIASAVLQSGRESSLVWRHEPVSGAAASENPWRVQTRVSQDGDKSAPFFSSLPQGETLTGIYRSAPFECPAKLSFWCAGHSGLAGRPINDRNYIRLREAANDNLLAESRPPRNDTAQRIEWNLESHASKQVVVELVDADTATGYAWLAVGRFSLAALNPSDTARRQLLACELVTTLKLEKLKPAIAQLATATPAEPGVASSAAHALAMLDGSATAAALSAAISFHNLPEADRGLLISELVKANAAERKAALRRAFQLAALRQQSVLAETLAGDPAGGRLLLDLVASGHAAQRVFAAPGLQAKFKLLGGELAQAAEKLSAELPSQQVATDQLIASRKELLGKSPGDAARGAAVFQKQCAACHQLAGQGKVIGPQLDGVGGRGMERLLEDLLDPNRNVDPAFRTIAVQTTAGKVLSGLVRREEGDSLILADSQGKEFTVSKAEIEAQTKTAISLMPSNLGEALPPAEFSDLLAFLLAQRAKPAP